MSNRVSGSKIGGNKVVETRVQKYMDQGYSEIEARKMVSDDYRRIGAIGGKNGTTGGFAARVSCNCPIIRGEHIKAQCAGFRGGVISKRVSKANNL